MRSGKKQRPAAKFGSVGRSKAARDVRQTVPDGTSCALCVGESGILQTTQRRIGARHERGIGVRFEQFEHDLATRGSHRDDGARSGATNHENFSVETVAAPPNCADSERKRSNACAQFKHMNVKRFLSRVAIRPQSSVQRGARHKARRGCRESGENLPLRARKLYDRIAASGRARYGIVGYNHLLPLPLGNPPAQHERGVRGENRPGDVRSRDGVEEGHAAHANAAATRAARHSEQPRGDLASVCGATYSTPHAQRSVWNRGIDASASAIAALCFAARRASAAGSGRRPRIASDILRRVSIETTRARIFARDSGVWRQPLKENGRAVMRRPAASAVVPTGPA